LKEVNCHPSLSYVHEETGLTDEGIPYNKKIPSELDKYLKTIILQEALDLVRDENLSNMKSFISIEIIRQMEDFRQLPDVQYTQVIYTLIKEQKYREVINFLSNEIQYYPSSRAVLSLLGNCSYYVQDYENAANCYSQLVKIYPDVFDYQIYHAQSLYKAGDYENAQKVCQSIDIPEHVNKIVQLQIAV
jgi:tetratricopeptide (TPR) repeat protein